MAEVTIPGGGALVLTWVELTDALSALHPWSTLDIVDDGGYYGGLKENRVTKWGTISRALSDRLGQFEGATFSWQSQDADRYLRGLLAGNTTKFFKGRPVVVRMIDDVSRRAELEPRTIMRGYVNDYRPKPGLGFDFSVQDVLATKFLAVGRDPAMVPQRKITSTDFPNADQDTIGKGVPIIYGDMSDVDVQSVNVPGLTFDASLGQVQAILVTDEGPTSGGFKGGVAAIVTQVTGGTNESIISAAAGTYSPTERSIRVNWNGVSGAGSYRIYIFDGPWGWTPFDKGGSPTFVRYTTHDNSTLDGTLGYDHSVLFALPSSGTNGLSGGTNVNRDQGHGTVRPIYVGQETISSVVYHKFLIAGHACKSIDELYVDGVAQKIGTDSSQAGSGGIWLIPGYAGWTAAGFSDVYVDISSHRYTVIYGKVGQRGPDRGAELIAADALPFQSAPAYAPLSLSLQGIEDDGDGGGTLITDVLRQFEHCLENFILQSYDTGGWLTPPTYEDDPSVPLIDGDSFDAAVAVAAARIGGGYPGAGIIGANGERVDIRAAIAAFNRSADVNLAFNRQGQIMVSMIDYAVSSLWSAEKVKDVNDILEDSFSTEDDFGSNYNVVPYRFQKDTTGRVASGWAGSDEEVGAALVHIDTAHADTSHTDTAHTDSHTDDPHGDGHLDEHGDDHTDFGSKGEHEDSHNDTHGDGSHEDVAHGDVAHGDSAHGDVAHVDVAHGDDIANYWLVLEMGGLDLDFIRDSAVAADIAGRKLTESEIPPRKIHLARNRTGFNKELGDVILVTHYQGVGTDGITDHPVRIERIEADPNTQSLRIVGTDLLDTVFGGHVDDHGDTAHGDVAHVDTHGDDAHGDIAHSDSAHSDVAHGDVAHVDVAHSDTAHGDTAHGDSHTDEGEKDEHQDSHDDVAHVDTGHGDTAHSDSAHQDVTHVDVAHGDSHTDTAHSDTAHSDVAHSDTAHSDVAHVDDYHADVPHGDSHADAGEGAEHEDDHTDTAHEDTAHGDVVHTDTAHSDVAHGDTAHADTAHSDVAHVDDHTDQGEKGEHEDAYTDVAHDDVPHADTAHSDSAHDDVAHGDVAHYDTPYNDTAHSDVAHSDVAHSDVTHDDVAHGDVAHSDTAHADTAHTDVAHGDAAHDDTHGDSPHSDTAHTDTHTDVAHGDTAHTDGAHLDTHGDSHTDAAHVDTPYTDIS